MGTSSGKYLVLMMAKLVISKSRLLTKASMGSDLPITLEDKIECHVYSCASYDTHSFTGLLIFVNSD
jgi:hypothetical protein